MEEKKKKYEAPKVIRLDDRQLGRGIDCTPGISDVNCCVSDGSGAVESCNSNGNSAVNFCQFGDGY